MKLSHTPIIALLALISALSLVAGKPARVSDADARRADYYYLEAVHQQAIGNVDAFAQFIARAAELNPLDPTIGYYNGLVKIAFSNNDSAGVAEGLALVRRYIDAYPDDNYGALNYVNFTDRLTGDTTEIIRVLRRLHDRFPTRQEYAYRLARAYAASGTPAGTERAIAIYDSITAVRGIDLGLSSNKIQLLYQAGDTAAMLDELHRLLAASPRSAENAIFAGEVFDAIGMPDSTIFYLDRACELDSTSGMAYYNRAEYYLSRGDSATYDREIFNALGSDNLDVDVKVELMTSYVRNLYTDTLQQPRIAKLFDELIGRHPHVADIHHLYAQYLLNKGDYPAAAEQESYVVDLNPDNLLSWQMLVSLYTLAGVDSKALDACNRALHYFPDEPSLLAALGSVYSRLEKPEKAIASYRKALKATDPADYEQRSALTGGIGDVFYTAGQKDSSFIYYNKAIELNPENLSALNNCAYYMAVEGTNLDRALQMIKKVVDRKPSDPTSLDTYAWVLFKMKKYPEAKEAIDNTIENSLEMSAEVLEHAGDIYFMNGEPDEAVKFWQQALDMNPDSEMLRRKVKNRTYFFK